MINWWTNIPVFEKIFWYISIPFSVVLFIQLIMTFTGLGDGEGYADEVDIDGDGDMDEPMESGFRLFTVRNFIIFFTVFGWSGIAFSNAGLNEGGTVIVSILLGIVVMIVVALLFYGIMKLSASGNIEIKNAIGLTGQVYIPIPANEKGIGKIQISIQDSLREVDAMTKGKALSTGTLVRAISVINDRILLVEKIEN